MSHTPNESTNSVALQDSGFHLEPETLIDLAADNAQLRVSLALAEKAGVRQDLIAQELKHRIGNLLTLVQAIARKSFREGDAGQLANFNTRMNALAAAQNLLIDSEINPTSIEHVVRKALAAHCPTGDVCSVSGPNLHIDGRRAHALTLALHELATNAAKYGALSTDAGRVHVTWAFADEALDFVWRESGGPAVTTPTRRGFGSSLIINNLAAAFAGDVDLKFNPGGVECRLRAAKTRAP
ncbi:MAG: sensor histidine kinase [Caulobacterales bacterium]